MTSWARRYRNWTMTMTMTSEETREAIAECCYRNVLLTLRKEGMTPVQAPVNNTAGLSYGPFFLPVQQLQAMVRDNVALLLRHGKTWFPSEVCLDMTLHQIQGRATKVLSQWNELTKSRQKKMSTQIEQSVKPLDWNSKEIFRWSSPMSAPT